jgi:hypothetical protein
MQWVHTLQIAACTCCLMLMKHFQQHLAEVFAAVLAAVSVPRSSASADVL